MGRNNPFESALSHEPKEYDKTIFITVEQGNGRLAYAYVVYNDEKAIHKGAALVPGATTWQGELLAAKDALTSLGPSQSVLVVTPTDRLHQRLTSGHVVRQFTADWEALKALAAQQNITWLCINGCSGDHRLDTCRAMAQKILQSEIGGESDSCEN